MARRKPDPLSEPPARVGSNPDCAGYEWAEGEVYGLKWLTRDRLGRLVSPSQHHLWTPGENVSDFADSQQGFYAYTREGGKEWWNGDVPVILKGYGKTTVGDRGFQCEKAEVVAIASNEPNEFVRWNHRLAAKAVKKFGRGDCPLASLPTVGSFCVLVVAITIILGAGLNSGWPCFGLLLIPAAICWWLWASKPFWSITYDGTRIAAAEYLQPAHPRLSKLYPDAKIYKSKKDMLRDKRIARQEPEANKVPKPKDPDFWTYKV